MNKLSIFSLFVIGEIIQVTQCQSLGRLYLNNIQGVTNVDDSVSTNQASPYPNQFLPGNAFSTPAALASLLTSNILSQSETVFPENVLLSSKVGSAPSIAPNYAINPFPSSSLNTQSSSSTATIIQDTTISNNLANALQLLLISQILGSTSTNNGLPEVALPMNGVTETVLPLIEDTSPIVVEQFDDPNCDVPMYSYNGQLYALV